MTDPRPVTRLLADFSSGDKGALARLLPLVYDELRAIASRYLRRERAGHTLQPTALVHEAYFKLVDQREAQLRDRSHFFAIASQAMRRILIDHARAHRASKRGGEFAQVSMDDAGQVAAGGGMTREDLLALDAALTALEQLDPQQSRIVEYRFFGGLTVEETAEVLGISPATVKRDWAMAKAWLHQRISGAPPDGL